MLDETLFAVPPECIEPDKFSGLKATIATSCDKRLQFVSVFLAKCKPEFEKINDVDHLKEKAIMFEIPEAVAAVEAQVQIFQEAYTRICKAKASQFRTPVIEINEKLPAFNSAVKVIVAHRKWADESLASIAVAAKKEADHISYMQHKKVKDFKKSGAGLARCKVGSEMSYYVANPEDAKHAEHILEYTEDGSCLSTPHLMNTVTCEPITIWVLDQKVTNTSN